jgi:DmsE family decaheme c-type cytochrome
MASTAKKVYSILPVLLITGILACGVLTFDRLVLAEEMNQEPLPSDFVGSETCSTCHTDQFEQFAATTMGKIFLKHPRTPKEALGCEGCHGPGRAHVEAGGETYEGLITFSKEDPTPIEQRNAVCLDCHMSTGRFHWRGSPHESRNLACTDCHRVKGNFSGHRQLVKATEIETCGQCHIQKRAQLMRSSHMPLREGKMTCSDCHNPHGTVTEKLLKANTTNELCYACHAEKRGPFLWEHPPVIENCSNCHEPHGSNHEKLLNTAKPRLCQRCHVESRHPTQPHDSMSRFFFNRSCTNCHTAVHGSNHPSGRSYVR